MFSLYVSVGEFNNVPCMVLFWFSLLCSSGRGHCSVTGGLLILLPLLCLFVAVIVMWSLVV